MIVIADTSGTLALFNRSDPEHFAVRRAADQAGALVISPLALTEIHHVASVRAGRAAADAILAVLADRIASTRIVVGNTSAAQIRTALDVRAKYDGLNLDIVDAICVTLADEFDTDAILTLDRRDFRAIRPLNRYPAFRILPDDSQ
ncbi:PIN domain-containing protein [Nocardia puris]|uniref:Ribonuclease VapC n=1 Tax=Nocardia puris TaxID=208602 RepID=A0A366DG20_9NOCA|nr:PIN domain-containing protein [Nocardia puris]MBF6211600.1 PIN domain-containing protein [Nocardia puris]MBF6366852.1 PIN domain-containing protein [Nocardia puris]MBF6460754.1 PIN domain-containing protein [Nocardia puris]RBO88971.1 putative nucleic acid-binding protein [Nocardia puris]